MYVGTSKILEKYQFLTKQLVRTFNTDSISPSLPFCSPGEITFSQNVTKLLTLMSTAQRLYSSGPAAAAGPLSKLLIIVSDGKGVLNEGKAAVRRDGGGGVR